MSKWIEIISEWVQEYPEWVNEVEVTLDWIETIPEWIQEYPEWVEGVKTTPEWIECGWADFNPVWIDGPTCDFSRVPFGRVSKQKQYDEEFLLKKRILNDDKEVLEILINFILSSGV